MELDKLLSTDKHKEATKLLKEIHELCKTSPLDPTHIHSVLLVAASAQMFLYFNRNQQKLADFMVFDSLAGGDELCAKIAIAHVLKGELK